MIAVIFEVWPKDGHLDVGSQRLFELIHRGDFTFAQQPDQLIGMEGFALHNVVIPPCILPIRRTTTLLPYPSPRRQV